MPTTILDGETFEQARHRRFSEEAKVIEKMQQDEIIRMLQEPVAEVVLRSHKVGFGRTEERKDIVFLTDVEVGQKLYAAPVQQVDLTDEELEALYDRHAGGWRVLFRAVIAAYKEKNK